MEGTKKLNYMGCIPEDAKTRRIRAVIKLIEALPNDEKLVLLLGFSHLEKKITEGAVEEVVKEGTPRGMAEVFVQVSMKEFLALMEEGALESVREKVKKEKEEEEEEKKTKKRKRK